MESRRLEAVQTLTHALETHYPEKGYYLSPSIQFTYHPKKGLSVIAKHKIPQNENIIVIPHSSCFSSLRVLESLEPEIASFLCKMEKDIEKNDMTINETSTELARSFVHPEEYSLALAIMRLLSLKCKMVENGDASKKIRENHVNNGSSILGIFLAQAATWPSEVDMKDSFWMYWDEELVKRVWRQSGLSLNFDQFRYNPRSHFESVIYPILSNHADDFIDPSLPSNSSLDFKDKEKKEALWNTFIYAMGLSWSRSHSGDEGEPELMPLIELFNGHSEKIDECIKRPKGGRKTIINVNINRGKWPFLGGGVFRNDCNVSCSAVHANRNIEEGEELIISYGDLSPLNFLLKYGAIPEEFLSHHDILSNVSLWIDPKFVPTEQMRVACLEKNRYPLESLKNNKDCPLSDLDSEDYDYFVNDGTETQGVGSFRQYLILAKLADDFELHRNFSTGLLRGPLYQTRVLPLMCETVDYNLELLGEESSADDVEKMALPETTNLEKTCLLARIIYRESLIIWRHAFAKKASALGSDDCLNTGESGCNVCGRVYPSLRCSKCNRFGKRVFYCSIGHQVLDWKAHKQHCGK